MNLNKLQAAASHAMLPATGLPATGLPATGGTQLSSNLQTNASSANGLLQIAGPPTAAAAFGEHCSPAELVKWSLEKFSDQPMVMTTSFGMEGCVLMDLYNKALGELNLPKLTVASIDTGFFFPETHQLRKKLIERYQNLDFVTWETPVSIEQQAQLYGPELWKNNPNMCCHIRKVQPMQDNIHRYRIWVTALRRSQTEKRATMPVMGWDWRYELLKFCPLVSWSRAEVWNYIQEHDVPFNRLHLQNYPSISCFHCTRPVPGSSPTDDAREGRWEGKEKTECGLHFSI
jgi:phosphoadenosine phosphosulfate reductase